MNELQIFNHVEFGNICTLTIDGVPWFVGKDVATVLGYSNTRDALSKHIEAEDKRGSQIATPSGIQEMTIINESGLYSLILSSKLETAKRFKRWVTSEVLPSIHKHGATDAVKEIFSEILAAENAQESAYEYWFPKKHFIPLYGGLFLYYKQAEK